MCVYVCFYVCVKITNIYVPVRKLSNMRLKPQEKRVVRVEISTVCTKFRLLQTYIIINNLNF